MPGQTQAPARPRASADADPEEREQVEREIETERAALRKAGEGEELTEKEERGALSYLLGARKALPYAVKATLETEDGPKPVVFVVKQLDGRKLDEIETRHRDRTTGIIATLPSDADIVIESLVAIEDETGRQIEPKSDEFRQVNPDERPVASASIALTMRFANQLGIISGVAREVRRISGWAPERVGQAERRLVDAAGG